MKKIGIITFHRAHNYGALLQVYALQTILKNKYNEVKVIDYYNDYIYNHYNLFPKIRKNIFKYFVKLIKSIKNFKNKKRRILVFNKFINDNLDLTKKYTERINLDEEKFTHVITGSDQVWSIGTVGCLSDIYTLNFLPNDVKKISYAASVGNNNDIQNNTKLFKEKISKIDVISVREESTREILSNIVEKDINVTLDPTLLVTEEEWKSRINNNYHADDKEYILVYIVEPNDELVKIVNELSRYTGIGIIHFGIKNPGFINEIKRIYTAGPFEFLHYIKNAKYVVTTSFHATVFSIIFNKEFWIVPHKQTGSRVIDLLAKFEISDRAITTVDEFKKINYDDEINYENVRILLEKEREKSINWLYSAIDN